jgi:hypothetical protein
LIGGDFNVSPEAILSEKWGVEQHQDCLYAGQTLYFLQRSLEIV